ncbi:uncharacterized protein LOC106871598 [Octopus bimaculoides]|uniref:uncharacterized protein LOC106871598 n=1 Tax=Octopus bimaculoides TaxID=37653 RepID=UPI00071E4692|nr:uncharacterized protein LOC106871598 [Octopus bimaculoides]|eukprot:XP_014773604.1 PREDICTED: uncharacterized protein LOC106871598 [Octopus bimaculoides]
MPTPELYLHLPIVIKRGYFRQVPLIVDYLKVDVNERDEDGKTALILCCYIIPEQYGVSLAQMLITKGCYLELSDKYGMNVLHHACIYERLKLIKVILRALAFSPDKKDHFGCTALHYSVRSGNVEITQLLTDYFVRYGVALDTVNNEGHTPLDDAREQGYKECAEILMNAVKKCTDEHPLCTQFDDLNISKEEMNRPQRMNPNLTTSTEEPPIAIFQQSPSTSLNPKSMTEHKKETETVTAPAVTIRVRENSVTGTKSKRYVNMKRMKSMSEIKPKFSGDIKQRESVYRMLTPRSVYVLNQRRKPNEWNVTKLIMEKLKDYRNNPAYFMMNIENLRHSTSDMNEVKEYPVISKKHNSEKCYPLYETSNDWRTDLKKIFSHYEYHCSLSYRSPACKREIPFIANIEEFVKDTETNSLTEKVSRRQRRPSNFSRTSAFADTTAHRKMKSRRSSVMSQNSSAVNNATRTGTTSREYSRTISSESTRSTSSSHKVL